MSTPDETGADNRPDERTPDDWWYVSLHTFKYTHLGHTRRGKMSRYKCQAFYDVHMSDGSVRERFTELWDEHTALIDQAGYAIDWTFDGYQVIDPPIEVILNADGKLDEVCKLEPVQSMLIPPGANEGNEVEY